MESRIISLAHVFGFMQHVQLFIGHNGGGGWGGGGEVLAVVLFVHTK